MCLSQMCNSIKSLYRTIVNYYKLVLPIKAELVNKYYSRSCHSKNVETGIVFMVDGKTIHGGLADRLKGITTIYNFSKKQGRKFYIYFNYPFVLENYLMPNEYDWRIDENTVCRDIRTSVPVVINDYQIPVPYHKILFYLLTWRKKQYHIYSNSPYAYGDFGQLFNELFKPSDRLRTSINKHVEKIGNEYISVTFRFQQLLGDFKERNYPTLDSIEQTKLISICKCQIEQIHQASPFNKILVTSDSTKFLSEIMNYDYTYVIPGNVVHMDWNKETDYQLHEKSFLDFFLIAGAKTSYLVYGHGLYHSGYAKLAAQIEGNRYVEINLDENNI